MKVEVVMMGNRIQPQITNYREMKPYFIFCRILTITIIAITLLFVVMLWPALIYEALAARPAVIPPASPQSGWSAFTPTHWLTSSTVMAIIQVTDTVDLNLTTASYSYSADGGQTWNSWSPAAAAGSLPTTAVISTPLLALTDGLTHAVRFAISDTVALPGTDFSPTYTLRVDTSPPTATFTSPANGAVVTANPLVLHGLAADATSGVARVEISATSGSGWVTAAGVTTWSYTWTVPMTNDVVYTFQVRAVDIAGNIQPAPDSLTVMVNSRPLVFLPILFKGPSDTFEPNDNRTSSYGPLQSGQVYESYIWSESDNWDCYWFEPTHLGQVVAGLTSIPPGADYDLYLYNSVTSSGSVARSQNTGSANEQISYNLPQLTRYYICVNRYSSFSSTDSYLLSVTYP